MCCCEARVPEGAAWGESGEGILACQEGGVLSDALDSVCIVAGWKGITLTVAGGLAPPLRSGCCATCSAGLRSIFSLAAERILPR